MINRGINRKKFYEIHKNFSCRTFSEYLISPGIRCKFDIIKNQIKFHKFCNALDLGCSGNSFLYLLNNKVHKSFYDLAMTPLKQYLQKNKSILQNAERPDFWHPVCGDITNLPYRKNSFDLVCALDVLEHIREDNIAISEISNILKNNGMAIITVPHRMDYYSLQDKLIGHYRRYEINQIIEKFHKNNLYVLNLFGIYGKLMKISKVQSIFPEKTEKNIQKLRERYTSNILFRALWDIFIKVSSYVMKLDAHYHSFDKIMNIGFIFIKR